MSTEPLDDGWFLKDTDTPDTPAKTMKPTSSPRPEETMVVKGPGGEQKSQIPPEERTAVLKDREFQAATISKLQALFPFNQITTLTAQIVLDASAGIGDDVKAVSDLRNMLWAFTQKQGLQESTIVSLRAAVVASLAGIDTERANKLRLELLQMLDANLKEKRNSQKETYSDEEYREKQAPLLLALAKSLIGVGSTNAETIRNALFEFEDSTNRGTSFLYSLAGDNSEEAFKKRRRELKSKSPLFEALAYSLTGIDTKRANRMRRIILNHKTADTALKMNIAESLAGCESELAWKIRDQLQADQDETALIISLRGVDSDRAYAIRDSVLGSDITATLFKENRDAVAVSLAGLNSEKANTFRNHLKDYGAAKESIAAGLYGGPGMVAVRYARKIAAMKAKEKRQPIEAIIEKGKNAVTDVFAIARNGFNTIRKSIQAKSAAVTDRGKNPVEIRINLLPKQQEEKTVVERILMLRALLSSILKNYPKSLVKAGTVAIGIAGLAAGIETAVFLGKKSSGDRTISAAAESPASPEAPAPVTPPVADGGAINAIDAAATQVPANCPEEITAACIYKGTKEAVTCVVDETQENLHATVEWALQQPQAPAAQGTLEIKFTGCPALKDAAQFNVPDAAKSHSLGKRNFAGKSR